MLSNKIYTAVNSEPIQLTSTPGIDLNAGMRRESSDSQAGVDIFAAAYSQALKIVKGLLITWPVPMHHSIRQMKSN